MENGKPKLILIADDDPQQRLLLRRMLPPEEYAILSLPDGVQAVQYMGALRTKVDLVILDMVMEGLDGAETFAALRKITPGLPVLFISGYSSGAEHASLLRDNHSAFLEKPFSEEQLLATLTQLTQG